MFQLNLQEKNHRPHKILSYRKRRSYSYIQNVGGPELLEMKNDSVSLEKGFIF